MSLAFALMAAINGSTGSSVKLSYGLKLQHQALPTSVRRPSQILVHHGWPRAARDAVAQTRRTSFLLWRVHKRLT